MSFKDQEILSSFLETPITEDMYSNEWRAIDADTNNDTHLKWNNSTLKSEWVSLKDSFITFDLTISGAIATRAICFKRSLLDFINSIQFSINGSSIINKTNLEHYNYWRLLLDSSKGYLDSPECEQIHFYPSVGNFGEMKISDTSYPIGTYTGGAVALSANSINTKFDEGFIKKIVVLASYASGDDYVMKCKIPLKMLHPFFSSDFASYPLNGFNLQLSVGHNKRKSEFNPIYDPTAEDLTTATAVHRFTIGTDCKWWVRHLVFNSDQAVQVAKMMSSKFTKEIIYKDVEVGTQAGGSAIMLTTTAVLPQRVMFAQYNPAGILAQEIKEPAITEAKQPTSYNIEVNGIRYLHHDLENDALQYQALQDACAQEIPDGAVPLLGFHDWRKFQKIQCVSLKRLKNRSSDPTALCNIKLTKSVTGSTVYYAVEVQKTLKMSYDNGQVILLEASS